MSSSQQPRIETDAVCRICHDGDSKQTPLYHPCLCKGSIRYIHENCLTKWLTHNKSLKCEVCGHSFIYKPIFVKGQQIPSSISYQSFIDIMCWIYDELITKNSDLILRLPIILFMWFIICPCIIFAINHAFYRYCILYDLIHFNSIYAPLQSLRNVIISYKSFNLSAISMESIMSYFCPYHTVLFIQNKCNQLQISMYYFFVHVILKGKLFIVFNIMIFGITICMKNTASIVRPTHAPNNANTHNTHNTNDDTDDDEKEMEIIEAEQEIPRRRKERVYFDDNEYKSPSLLVSDMDDLKYNENYNAFEEDYDADMDDDVSDTSSTLSQLEMKVNELQERIKLKKEEQEQEVHAEHDDEEKNQELDELDILLDCIGLNDDIQSVIIKHCCWIAWLLSNHISHLIVPHCIGQHTLAMLYLLLWILPVLNDRITAHILDLMDVNQYNVATCIYTPCVRHMMVVMIGYCSCFMYQWMLCKVMPWMVTDVQQLVRSSVLNVYLWLFDKKDILKGCVFVLLKFVFFPILLTLTMECCFIPIREESQWRNYAVVYETLMFNHDETDGISPKTASSVMYVVLMLLWTSIAICTYLSTVDVLEKAMRPTAFTYLFRSVIETKNWLHPFSYQEECVIQFRKWCMTTLHFMVVVVAFLGIPSYVMSQCNHVVPLNVPSVGKIKTFHVRALLLQDYVLLFSVLPMLLFWEPILRALVVQTLHISAYLLNLKFYLLRNYNVREDGLNQDVWHDEQPFMDIVEEDNHVPPLPDLDDEDDIESEADNAWFEFEMSAWRQETVAHLVDDAVEYSIHSLANELEQKAKKNDGESDVVKSITKCIEFVMNSSIEIDVYKIHRMCRDDLINVHSVIDYVCNDNAEYGDTLSVYRVKWKEGSVKDATWEDMDDLHSDRCAIEHIDRYKCALRESHYEKEVWRYQDDQMLLRVLWSILDRHGNNKYNKFGVIWTCQGSAFAIVNIDKFTNKFLISNDDVFYSLIDPHMIDGKHYALFHWRMCILGFDERIARTNRQYRHPCFKRKSNALLPLIGKNRVSLLGETMDSMESAAVFDEAKNEVIEIPEANHNDNAVNPVNPPRRDGMDMMGLFDGIDLGGADNIIPAPIVMNVQLDNFGRLIKINVELDTYNEAHTIVAKTDQEAKIGGEDVHVMPSPSPISMDDHVLQHKEEKEEEGVHIAELMRSLNGYQKSELLRDILSICHPLYITEEQYCLIYSHNTKWDVGHPLLRVLKKPSQLISIDDIVTFCDIAMLYVKILCTLVIAVFILNSFHLILFLQCLVYGRKLWKILSLIPKFFIFELGFTNFTRFDDYGIMSFAFNEDSIHDLHCIALSLWWFPAMYGALNIGYHCMSVACHKCSLVMDHTLDLLFSRRNPMSCAAAFAAGIYEKSISCIEYLMMFGIHHVVLPLLFGFCFFFSLWSPVFVGCNESFSCSILEAWIEGFFVWNVCLPIIPLRTICMGDSQLFKQRLKVYLETKFENMNLWINCGDIYWPLLKVIIIHLFIPIALIQSCLFKYLLFDSMFKDSLLVEMKNYSVSSASTNIDELLFEFNRKWYLRYIMRKLIQIRLFIGYQSAIRNGCDKIWHQFINDKYVVGKRLVNYYYNKNKDDET